MNALTWTIAQEAVFVLSLLLLMGSIAWSARSRMRKRASELSIAGEMLEKHYDHLARFMDDPAAPQVLKDTLLGFSDAAADKEVAIAVAQEFARRDRRSRVRDDDETVVAMEALARHRPDLTDAFYNSVTAGIMAMYLRWPETAKFRDLMMARVATGHASEVSFATRAAKRHDHNGDANFGGGLVPA